MKLKETKFYDLILFAAKRIYKQELPNGEQELTVLKCNDIKDNNLDKALVWGYMAEGNFYWRNFNHCLDYYFGGSYTFKDLVKLMNKENPQLELDL